MRPKLTMSLTAALGGACLLLVALHSNTLDEETASNSEPTEVVNGVVPKDSDIEVPSRAIINLTGNEPMHDSSSRSSVLESSTWSSLLEWSSGSIWDPHTCGCISVQTHRGAYVISSSVLVTNHEGGETVVVVSRQPLAKGVIMIGGSKQQYADVQSAIHAADSLYEARELPDAVRFTIAHASNKSMQSDAFGAADF